MKKTYFLSLSRKTRRLLTSSNERVPSRFFVYPIMPPSYFALTVCAGDAGAGAGLLLGDGSTLRARCANVPVARLPNRNRIAENLMLLSPLFHRRARI